MDKIQDESFRKFLEKIQQQNQQDLALQSLQVKYEREMAGEDNDKREKQLQELANILENIEKAITGIDVNIDSGELGNQTQILQKLLEEQTLIRKLNEGSLEYDKESAQYRNLSGREIESDVSGKTIKKGGYIDFETATNRLAGQSKRVRESQSNQIQLKPFEVKPIASRPSEKSDATKEDTGIESLGNLSDLKIAISNRLTGIFDFLTKDVKERGLFGKQNTDVEKVGKSDSKQVIVSSDTKSEKSDSKQVIVSSDTKSEKSDNIITSQEKIAEISSQDFETTKNILNVNQLQLEELKQIKFALAPKTPSELPETKAKPPVIEPPDKKEGTTLGDALSSASDFLGRGGKSAARGSPSLGGKLARFAGSTGGKLLGGAAALGLGAYTAYKGYTGAEEEKQAQLQEIEAKVKSGEISPEEGEKLKKEAASQATENKGGAIGEGTGMAAGAIGGAVAGAKLGAFFGPAGVAVGGLAGGALGAFSGSKVGQNIGGAIGKGVAGIKGFFGMEDTAKKEGDGSAKLKNQSFSVSGSQGSVEGNVIDGKYYINGNEVSEKEYNETRKMYGVESASSKSPASTKDLMANAKPIDASKSVQPVTPAKPSQSGSILNNTTTENNDLSRSPTSTLQPVQPVISNNVNSVNTTSYVPIKPTPRSDQASSLDRYMSRTAVY